VSPSATQTELFVVAAITLIGFFGNLLLKRKGVPVTIFLIFVGLLINMLGILPAREVDILAPLLSSLTLIMILFNVGIQLDIRGLMEHGASSIARSTLYIALSILLLYYVFTALFGFSGYEALFLGSIVGGETTMVVVPYIAAALSSKGITESLTLESVYNSMVLIILFFALLSGYQSSIPFGLSGLGPLAQTFFSQLSVAIVGGVLLSLLWVRFAALLGNTEYFYVATLGYVILVYWLVSLAGGSGVLSVLVFALTVRNLSSVSSNPDARLNVSSILLNYLSAVQDEITFFLRTFFLVFLGLELSVGAFFSVSSYVLSGTAIAVLVFSRLVSVELVHRKMSQRDRDFIFFCMAQGLTPAVLATTILQFGVQGGQQLILITTFVIIFTNLLTVIGTTVVGRAQKTGTE
jgi:NhaP-type Na+/H+ or K+/H+ antiporter